METGKVGVTPFLLSIAMILVVELALSGVMSAGMIPKLPALGFARIVEIILFLLIFSSFGGLAAIGLAHWQLKSGLKRGLVWSVGFAIVTAIGFGILFILEKNPLTMIHASLPGQTDKLVLFFILAGLVGPVAEEIFFRGILYGIVKQACVSGAGSFLDRVRPECESSKLAALAGTLMAIALVAFIFAFVHPRAGFPQIVGGVLMTAAYEIEGKLMVPITLHVLGNTAIHVLSLLAP